MDKIKLLYIENVISRQCKRVQQQLTFFIQVENIAYDKQVDVLWAGEDGVWHTLVAKYWGMRAADEAWYAQVNVELSKTQSLPGNIVFSLRYQVNQQEYWDNNFNQNYTSEADSGIKLGHHNVIQTIYNCTELDKTQKKLPITIAVADSLGIEAINIHWTTDDWKTVQIKPCRYRNNYWNKIFCSNARNVNQYGVQIWTTQIETGDVFRVEYSFCCEGVEQTYWDNNQGRNYSFQHESLKVLILNLHCYQEDNQDHKLSIIAKAIDEQKVDIICLQEVAENWYNGAGDWESNAAKIINDRLSTPYHLQTDWSHLGFDQFREGVAILSRYPMIEQDSRYVSDSHDIYSIHSRKVVKSKVYVPFIGAINVFSVHLSWLEDGFQQQFQRLQDWVNEIDDKTVKATLLCGDFNITAGSTGYQLVVESEQYDDQFLAANNRGIFDQIFRVNDPHWQHQLTDDYRIDYIFMNKQSELRVTSSRVIFTDQDYGQVSDHCGYLMSFEPNIKAEE